MREIASSAGTIGAIEDQMATADLAATFQAFETIQAAAEAREDLADFTGPIDSVKALMVLMNPVTVVAEGIRLHRLERKASRLTGEAIVARGYIDLTNKQTEGQ